MIVASGTVALAVLAVLQLLCPAAHSSCSSINGSPFNLTVYISRRRCSLGRWVKTLRNVECQQRSRASPGARDNRGDRRRGVGSPHACQSLPNPGRARLSSLHNPPTPISVGHLNYYQLRMRDAWRHILAPKCPDRSSMSTHIATEQTERTPPE